MAAARVAIELRAEAGEVLPDRVEHRAGAEEEHPAVPEEAAVGEELLGALAVGLLHEAARAVHALGDRIAHLDVAVAGLGAVRADPDGDDVAAARRLRRERQDRRVLVLVGDVVIGGEHHADGVGIDARDPRGGPPDAGRRVAPDRLGEDVLRREREIRPRGRGEALGRHDEHVLFGDRLRHAPNGRREERLVTAGERQELLGSIGARERPEAGAGSTGHDDRERAGHRFLLR